MQVQNEKRPENPIAMQVDSNEDGLVDLKELSTAMSKWLALVAYPGSRDLLQPFATARDIALDFFIATNQDPRRYCHSDLDVLFAWTLAIPGVKQICKRSPTSRSSKHSLFWQSY